MSARRYDRLFRRLRDRGEGAFVPFVVLGDPDPVRSLAALRALIEAGADAIEVGLPFSDPVADGPVVQAACARARASGTRTGHCWEILRTLRGEDPEIPIGVLAYANLVMHRGADAFYRSASLAGADSVLVPDLPLAESGPVLAAARARGVAPVLIVPPNVDAARLRRIARRSEGYTYVTTREGVTGIDHHRFRDARALLSCLRALGAPPALLGFGISEPEQVRGALAAGAAGAISGSATIRLLAARARDAGSWPPAALVGFVRAMKAATRSTHPGGSRR